MELDLPDILAVGQAAAAIRERLKADFPGISVRILQAGIDDMGAMQNRIENADVIVTMDRLPVNTHRIRAELAWAIRSHMPVWVDREMLDPDTPGVRLSGIRGMDNIVGLEDMDDLVAAIRAVASCEADWAACRTCRLRDACPRQWS